MSFSNPEQNIKYLNLEKSMCVADLGVGSGFYAFALAKIVGANGKVYAIDVQKGLLDRVKNESQKQRLNNIEIIWGDVEKAGGTKLKDEEVDAVVISNILFQINHKEEFAKEAVRILKPRGQVLVIDWSDTFSGLGPQASSLFLFDKAQKLFENAGLVFCKPINAGDHHYGFILKKI